jgi:hypothetical protein
LRDFVESSVMDQREAALRGPLNAIVPDGSFLP